MELSDLIKDAAQSYRGRVLFTGSDTPASRTYYRLLVSLDQAVRQGIIDITLYLTQEDFRLLCAGMDIDPAQAADKQMNLTDDVPLIVPDEPPPFSLVVGFGTDGRQTPFPVLSDEAFVDLLK